MTPSKERDLAMFGLPASTTWILGAIMAFWVIYTLVFFFSTSRWSVEDHDYSSSGDDDETEMPSPRAGGQGGPE